MGTFSRGTLDPHYVTGLIDASGSFTFSRSSKQLAIYFALKLPLEDRPLLEDLRSYFGTIGPPLEAGRIYEARNTAYLRLTRRHDLARVVTHFEQHPLRSRKRHTFEIWKQMVHAKQQFRRPDRALLNELAARLRIEA